VKKVKRGALGIREFSVPEVINIDKAAEWKVRRAKRRRRS
jgi:hypothetical protein